MKPTEACNTRYSSVDDKTNIKVSVTFIKNNLLLFCKGSVKPRQCSHPATDVHQLAVLVAAQVNLPLFREHELVRTLPIYDNVSCTQHWPVPRATELPSSVYSALASARATELPSSVYSALASAQGYRAA